MDLEIERKWQEEWEKNKVFEAKVSDKPKFYMVFAYPTVSGTLHIGHMRSYTLPDVVARYKRMKGYEVFFPLGFHATGVDCLKILRECEEDAVKGTKKYGIEVEAARSFKTPLDVEKYLEKKMIAAFKTLGLSIDTRAAVSTIDPHYNKFIQWQYRKLMERENYLIQGDYVLPYCPRCDHPVSVDTAAAEIAEGSEAEVKQYVVIKFKGEDGRIYPIATLRPETVFGVTNIWVHPERNYLIASVDEEEWVVSESAANKLRNLGKGIIVKRIIKGRDLTGKKVINPANESEVEIIPADFVDVDEATGVVMSVPAHDPFDYIHYKKATNAPDESIPLVVDIPLEGVPSAIILKKFGEDIEGATKELYKLEYRHKIRMEIPVIGGIPTPQAKEKVVEHLKKKNAIDEIYEFTLKKVECRCGAEIIFKKIKGQWFVNYANQEWKEKTKEWIKKMSTYPPEYKKELPFIIDWLKERPLVRKQGLGTQFPFGEGIIEPLADSTIYMAFYFVSKAFNEGKISLEEIDDELFDYIYFGKGGNLKVKKEVAEEIRKEFLYFYPLDINFGGKEHKSVHFPFFIFHHVAVFPEEHWPRGIFVNWHLIREGEKMSKSKGNVVFWHDAIEKYGADAVRLYESHGANQWTDFDWKDKEMEMYARHVESFGIFLESAMKEQGKESEWLNSILSKRIEEIEEALENYELRKAAGIAFFDLRNDFQWHFSKGGKISRKSLEKWLKLLSIFVPHVCEEYWHRLGNKTFLSKESWPEKEKISEEILKLEKALAGLMEDLNNVMRIVKEKKGKIYIYAVEDREVEHLKEAKDFISKRFGLELTIFSVKDKEKYDPMGKAAKAKPLKPAIYLE